MDRSVGSCDLCGREVYGSEPLGALNAYTCERCGRWVCSACGGYTPGYGYGEEDETKYNWICKECYYELQAKYAEKWKEEYGTENDQGLQNPYDLSQEEDEWRRRMREYKAPKDYGE